MGMKTEGLFFREVIDFPKRSANLLNFCKARDWGKNITKPQISYLLPFLSSRRARNTSLTGAYSNPSLSRS
jgi:hypothetical protein